MSARAVPEVRRLAVARHGKPSDWSEDASRVECDGDHDAWSAFMALADGAGSTAFAGEWARALVDAARPEWLDGDLRDRVTAVRDAFDPLAAADGEDDDFLLQNRWHERGAAATLVLAHATHVRGTTRCRVVAVGDSVAIVSGDDRLTSFPIRASREFSTRTTTIKTRVAHFDVNSWTTELGPGTLFALASDGIAKWLLSESERNGAAYAHELLRRLSADALPDVEDDVTLLILNLPRAELRRARLVRLFGLGKPRR